MNYILLSILGLTGNILLFFNFIFLFTSILGFQLYKVSGYNLLRFYKKIKYSSILENEKPEGWILGKYFIGYIFREGGNHVEYTLYLILNKKMYNKYFDTKDENKIIFYEKDNSQWIQEYISRKLNFDMYLPRKSQKKIINLILEDFNKNKYSTVLLYGPANSGKTMISILLANRLIREYEYENVKIVDTFNPCESRNSFINLYEKMSPNSMCPLIVCIDEIDVIVENIHTQKVKQEKEEMIQIKNKCDWNLFFDRFDRNFYPWVIFIMTSNKDISYFDKLDTSYFRRGRVNLKLELK